MEKESEGHTKEGTSRGLDFSYYLAAILMEKMQQERPKKEYHEGWSSVTTWPLFLWRRCSRRDQRGNITWAGL
jgi:hypothetical protein